MNTHKPLRHRPTTLTRMTVGMLIGLLVVTQGSAGAIRWGEAVLQQPAEWYSSSEARAAADNVLIYQSEFGGWPKNMNLLDPITAEALEELNKGGKANTIDNGATTLPMRFLALVYQAAPDEKYRAAFTRGVNYLLGSQYPNGGFPQYFPLRGDKYYSRITYNDDAMVSALEILRDVASGQAPYDLVDNQPWFKSVAKSPVRRTAPTGGPCISIATRSSSTTTRKSATSVGAVTPITARGLPHS
jgi:hypothetical protein